MISRKYRAPRELFLGRKEGGRRIGTPYGTLRIRMSALPYNRYSIWVSGKVEPRAVRRNFLRRRFLRRMLEWPNAHADILFIASPRLKGADKKHVDEAAKHIRHLIAQHITPHV